MATHPTASAKPEITPVSDLLDAVASGEYRIPRFQRPYVWSPEDMILLFDSISKGYPIGSMLIWQTERDDITSLPSIGPAPLPDTGPTIKSYVVDGHQRLATLLGVLKLPEDYPREKLENWRWWIAYDLKSEIFIHLRGAIDPIPLHLLPLRSLLRTVDFARRTREIANSENFDESEIVILLDRADSIQRSIREYRIPLTVMKYGTLDDAVNIFARVNQRGRNMTPDQMVSALTFRDKGEGDFDLSEAIDDVLGELREKGHGDLQRRVILQVILALAELDFTRPSYERIVNRKSYEKMTPAVELSKKALLESVDFLSKMIGLNTSKLLPYASILVLLAIFFSKLKENDAALRANKIELIIKWFWATSFNGWFAGANTTLMRQAAEKITALATADTFETDDFESFFFEDRPIRAFPTTFDRRSARVRASLLVQILVGKPLDPRNGKEIDGAMVFSDEGSRDIPYFYPNQKKPIVSNPANRVILPEGFSRNARGAFMQLDESEKSTEILNSHFISAAALKSLKNDAFEDFIQYRERSILEAEKHFLSVIGLTLDEVSKRSIEEIDTDD